MLPTCPSCGQSVLEDNVVDCPFCGAAMDGSRGAKNTPRPKAGPAVNRPGARKVPDKPATSSPGSGGTSAAPPALSAAKPSAAPARAGKPVVDEDDPFGIGSGRAAASAIQAVLKPEKGKMHRVICPMCEQQGFVAKSAVGKLVRCANEKCMVPLFTAPDPNAPVERKPTRLSDEAEAARRAAESSPKKKNPVVIYAVIGGVLLVVTMIVLPMLTKPDVNPDLNKPVPVPEYEDEDAIAAEQQKKKAAAQAAADAVNPVLIVGDHAKRMIGLARQANLRDKSWARRMTGDLFVRLNDMQAAGTEFNQLVSLDRSRGFYRIEPHLGRYWRAIASGDAAGAKKALDDALADVPSIPRTGRQGTDACLALAAALFQEGRADQAAQFLAVRQLDSSVPHRQDMMGSTAWTFAAGRCREAGLSAPAALDQLLWIDPLHTAVAGDLASHQRWTEAINWSKTASSARSMSDALVLVADIAAEAKADSSVFAQIEEAVRSGDLAGTLRVRAAVAAATKDVAKIEACLSTFSQMQNAIAAVVPTSQQLVQNEIPDRDIFLDQLIATGETVRAALITGKPDLAATALNRCLTDAWAVAPPTTQLRQPLVKMTQDEGSFKRQLAAELLIPDNNRFASEFRSYRRHLEQLLLQAEDRRLTLLLVLSRIARSGGAEFVRQSVNASAELSQELKIDALVGLLNASARAAGQSQPILAPADPPVGAAAFGTSELVLATSHVLDLAWANREQKLPECLVALELRAGTTRPGLRLALLNELVESAARTASDPAIVLNAVSALKNGAWREELFEVAGRVIAERRQEKQAEAWTSTVKVLPLEHIALLYGISLGMLDRPAPATASPTTGSDPASASSATNSTTK
jgi:hypothetical protein